MSDSGEPFAAKEPFHMVARETAAAAGAGGVTLSFRNANGDFLEVEVARSEAVKLRKLLNQAIKASSSHQHDAGA